MTTISLKIDQRSAEPQVCSAETLKLLVKNASPGTLRGECLKVLQKVAASSLENIPKQIERLATVNGDSLEYFKGLSSTDSKGLENVMYRLFIRRDVDPPENWKVSDLERWDDTFMGDGGNNPEWQGWNSWLDNLRLSFHVLSKEEAEDKFLSPATHNLPRPILQELAKKAFGTGCLHYAAVVEDLTFLKNNLTKENVNQKIQPSETQPLWGFTLLHIAVIFGQIKVMKLLLEAGADVEETDERRETALYLAAELGHIAAMKVLLEHGADVNSSNAFSWTPLLAAACLGQIEAMHLLLDNGAIRRNEAVKFLDEYVSKKQSD